MGIIVSHLASHKDIFNSLKFNERFLTDCILPCQIAQPPIIESLTNPGTIPAKNTAFIETPAVTP